MIVGTAIHTIYMYAHRILRSDCIRLAQESMSPYLPL